MVNFGEETGPGAVAVSSVKKNDGTRGWRAGEIMGKAIIVDDFQNKSNSPICCERDADTVSIVESAFPDIFST